MSFDNLFTAEYLNSIIGAKVRLKYLEKIYYGEITSFSTKLRKLNLIDVKDESETVYRGLQAFFFKNIGDINVLEYKKQEYSSHTIDKKIEQVIQQYKQPTYEYLGETSNEDPDEITLTNELEEEINKRIKISDDNHAEQTIIPIPNSGVPFEIPPFSILINEINEDFHSSLNSLNQKLLLGVGARGENIGRHGIISWLTVATSERIYLYDMIELHKFKDILVASFRKIFESKKILKVIHDSRWLSDALFHIFKIKLENVFDTQVVSALNYQKLNKKDIPPNLLKLPELLKYALRLKYHQVNVHEVDEKEWLVRPLNTVLRQYLVRDVLYLHKLHSLLDAQYLSEYNDCMNLYLALSDDKFDISGNLVPKQLKDFLESESSPKHCF